MATFKIQLVKIEAAIFDQNGARYTVFRMSNTDVQLSGFDCVEIKQAHLKLKASAAFQLRRSPLSERIDF
jgi:hypothetical protein